MQHDFAKPPVLDPQKPVSACSRQELAGIIRGDIFERLERLPVPWTQIDRTIGAVWGAALCKNFPAPTLQASVYGLILILRTSLITSEWSASALAELGSILFAPPTPRQLEAAQRLERTCEEELWLHELFNRFVNDLPKA